MQFKRNFSSCTKWTSKWNLLLLTVSVSLFLLQLSFACSPVFYFSMEQKLWKKTYHSPPYFSVIARNLITIIRFARYHLLVSSRIFMTNSLYLDTVKTWWNLNGQYYYLTSTKFMTCQIVENCSPFQSLNMLPFHIWLERLKLIYHGLMSKFSK